MDDRRLVKISKYLSRHLRHQPERLGLTVGPGGWVNIDDLLAACRRHQFPVSRPELEEVVSQNDKKRFSIDAEGRMIRANQGHSIDVDLQLKPATPPPWLYHGTGDKNVGAILGQGIQRMGRHHVHLSRDVKTAVRVGARHGRPVVLAVNAAAMTADGYVFFVSGNHVWLTASVPPAYLRRL